jgi:hypothetical protein
VVAVEGGEVAREDLNPAELLAVVRHRLAGLVGRVEVAILPLPCTDGLFRVRE